MGDRILIVEDEQRLRDILCDYFRAKGEEPVGLENGQQAVDCMADRQADAVLLDILMPELDGFSVCRALRRHSSVPIIFLTALSDEEEKLRGYALGADDYVTKPYSMAVLYARTKALIARTRGAVGEDGWLESAGIRLNLKTHEARINGRPQELPNREFALLRCLMEHRNQVLSRQQLLTMVWGYDYEGDERTVDTHIKKLRARGAEIETIIRVGYRLREKTP